MATSGCNDCGSLGAELIAAERQRQIEVEGYTADHDDDHKDIAFAADCYLHLAWRMVRYGVTHDDPKEGLRWPWEWEAWKPSPDPVRNLVKAGALIAAEIDRLSRMDP